ncbi:MAG TPA: hypothetical protein VJ732_09605 [Bryobacteraceae bacterium]|nr:hypothetical protein [Bryobacteraceae bacterium]
MKPFSRTTNRSAGLGGIYMNVVLTAIAVFLGILAFRPAVAPAPVAAQSSDHFPAYIEPGVTSLRKPDGTQQVQGKVVVDLRNGNIWGFPTLSGAPYPVDMTTPKPPVSKPMYLGRFDLEAMDRLP